MDVPKLGMMMLTAGLEPAISLLHSARRATHRLPVPIRVRQHMQLVGVEPTNLLALDQTPLPIGLQLRFTRDGGRTHKRQILNLTALQMAYPSAWACWVTIPEDVTF